MKEDVSHAEVNVVISTTDPRMQRACDDEHDEIAQEWGFAAEEMVTCLKCLALTAGAKGHDTIEALMRHEAAIRARRQGRR